MKYCPGLNANSFLDLDEYCFQTTLIKYPDEATAFIVVFLVHIVHQNPMKLLPSLNTFANRIKDSFTFLTI